jgi:hypothetical protein
VPRISISYRRADSAGITGRIFDRLRLKYGAESVFIDIDSIPLGTNYKQHIDDTLHATDVLLVIVGPRWLGERPDGGTRIDEDNDPVRLEVEAALRYGRLIIPVLADGASMPSPTQLPESLREFPYINAAEIDSGRFFENQLESLTRYLDTTFAKQKKAKPDVAARKVPLPKPKRLVAPPAFTVDRRRLTYIAAAIVALCIIGVVIALGPRPASRAAVALPAEPVAAVTTLFNADDGPPGALPNRPADAQFTTATVEDNGVLVDVQPRILAKGRLFLPLTREDGSTWNEPTLHIFQSLGARVSFDAYKVTITFTKPGMNLVLTAENSATRNGDPFPVDQTFFSYRGALMVPVRMIVELLGGSFEFERGVYTIRH